MSRRRFAEVGALAGASALIVTAVGLAIWGSGGASTVPGATPDAIEHDPAGASFDLQTALDEAAPGSTVTVPAGEHQGSFVVRVPGVTVRGEAGALLDGMEEGSVLTIDAPDVTVRDLSVHDSGSNPVGTPSAIFVGRGADDVHVQDVVIEHSFFGITVQHASGVVIERTSITGSGIITGELHAVDAGASPQAHDMGTMGADESDRLRGDGIWLFEADDAVVRDCQIEHVRDGVYLTYGQGATLERNHIVDSRYAVHDMFAHDATIVDNVMRANLTGMVLMYGDPVLAQGNVITESGSPSTGFGVLIKDAGGVTLRANVIADNRVGVHVEDAGRTGGDPTLLQDNTIAMNQIGLVLFPSADTVVTGNGFVENTTQVALGGQGTTQAVWTVEGVGNYWSDYGGFDASGDGTGDLAYTQSGRVSQLLAEDPLLLALASGPAFRLLSAVEDKWAPTDPVVMDVAPQTSPGSPSLRGDPQGTRVPLWIPGAAAVLAGSWSLVRARRPRRRMVATHG